MIFKVVSVFWYMLRSLVAFGFVRLFRPASLDKAVEADYLDWAIYTLKKFDAVLAVDGIGNIPPRDGRRLVIMSNHQSQLDIPTLVAVLDRRIGFVAKKELGSIPLLSFWMRQIGCVFIDRADKSGAHRALENAAKAMREHPIVVFPEGTRSKTGQLLPLKIGGFRLAMLAKARVLPVFIEGSRDAVESRKGRSGPIPVKVRLFPPLDMAEMEDSKASLNRIKDYVDACWRADARGVPAPPPVADAAAS